MSANLDGLDNSIIVNSNFWKLSYVLSYNTVLLTFGGTKQAHPEKALFLPSLGVFEIVESSGVG